ncbi:MAG: TonB family protein [bacterium]|nr:TonB family protein [bacterium]
MKNALSISLTAHVIVALVWAQLVSFRHVRYVPRDVTMVQLVSLEEAEPKPKPRITRPIPAPVIKEVEPPPPDPAPEDDLVVPEETKKPEPRRLEEKVVTPQPPVPEPNTVESSAAGADTVPAPSTGDITIDDADFPFMYYLTNIKRKIAAYWNVPGTTAEAKYCVVRFKVLRSGAVQSPMIELPSGSFLFDQAALRAVTQANPLPPLPSAFKDDYLGVHFSFAYEEE